MASLILRFAQSKTIQSLQRASGALFGKYLLWTNISISVSLSATGDVLQQHYDIIRSKFGTWDKLRTSNMALTGLPIGVLCHYWYLYLDRRLPGRTFKIVMKKVVVDQILFSPVLITVFFFTIGVLEGSKLKEMAEETVGKGARLYLAEWFIWPPAQTFSFYVLPTRFRVLYDNTISLGFDTYTSYVKYKADPIC